MKTYRFKSFSSGSCGNCYFLGIFDEGGACECGVLVDAGFSPRRLKKELEREGLGFDDIAGLLVTHDHNDHIRSLGSYCKHLGKDVWTPPELADALSRHFITGEYYTGCRRPLSPGWNELVPGRIRARYFAVPHDASCTFGYALLLDEYRFVIMTDIGRMVPQALNYARQADTVVIESNYDLEMLRNGPYPKDLQDRICGGHGHLSNDECAEAVRDFVHPGLRNIFLCHLSEHNNTPELAYRTSAEVLSRIYDPQAQDGDRPPRLCPLPRMSPSPLFIL
ncbi:MAG: MBL fold metallo-hydrolase [Bacteroidales bacterium]|nr:MBL fold metallo-hydrolase [Bacteroidales bacterium]